MAEYIFLDMLKKKGISERFSVASRATSDEEIRGGRGADVYPPARAELLKNGIPCGKREATRLTREDYNKYDLFLGMDCANIRNMLRIFGCDPEGKVERLMDRTPHPRDVADPWYSDRFDIAYRDIKEGCEFLLRDLLRQEKEGPPICNI